MPLVRSTGPDAAEANVIDPQYPLANRLTTAKDRF